MINEKKLLEKLEELKFANEQKGYDTAKDVIQEIINLVDEQPKTDWIPCEERLPSEKGYYLISSRDKTRRMFYWNGEYWKNEKFDITDNVIAWTNLPQPYKKEGAVDECN